MFTLCQTPIYVLGMHQWTKWTISKPLKNLHSSSHSFIHSVRQLSLHLPTQLAIHQSTFASIHPFTHQSIHISINFSICFALTHTSIHPSTHISSPLWLPTLCGPIQGHRTLSDPAPGPVVLFNIQLAYTWCKELTHLKRPWCWARLKAGREGDDRGWDGWMVSPTQWTWV